MILGLSFCPAAVAGTDSGSGADGPPAHSTAASIIQNTMPIRRSPPHGRRTPLSFSCMMTPPVFPAILLLLSFGPPRASNGASDSRPVKMRHKLFRSRHALLNVSVREPKLYSVIHHGFVFKGGQAAVHPPVFCRPIHRRILIHQRKLHPVAERPPDPVQHPHALMAVSRQYQMANQDPFSQLAVRVKLHGAGQFKHLADRLRRRRK